MPRGTAPAPGRAYDVTSESRSSCAWRVPPFEPNRQLHAVSELREVEGGRVRIIFRCFFVRNYDLPERVPSGREVLTFKPCTVEFFINDGQSQHCLAAGDP